MSDFPHKGTVDQTRQWLDANGFEGKFANWKADALIGSREDYVLSKFTDRDEGERLCGLLNTARADRSIQGI